MSLPLSWFRTALVLAAAALAGAGCEVNLNTEGVTSTETKTFTVAGQPDLSLETFDGSIEIHSWDRSEVDVAIEKRGMEQADLDAMTVETDQQGDRILVRVTGPARRDGRSITVGIHISPAARLLVSVPRRSLIQARTGDGAIQVENIEGRLSLRTDDGSVAVDRVSGELEVRTGDGSIRVEKADGRLDLETHDGSITVDARPSVLRARTGDGSIRVQVEPGAVMADVWEVTTGDGSVTLRLPPAFDADIDAETGDGSVRSSHPGLDAGGEGERRERSRRLRQKMGRGGHVLRVRTGDGSIRVES